MTDSNGHGTNDGIMKIREVAGFLAIPLSTAYKLTRERKLPGHKVGKHWRFIASEIHQWLLDGQPELPPLPKPRKAKR